jgi:hypothetical protein
MATMTTPAPAARLLTAWERAGKYRRSVTISVQLAVVQYCTDVPGTPVPTLDDVRAVRALVASIAPHSREGDRVAFRNYAGRVNGTVTGLDDDGFVCITWDDGARSIQEPGDPDVTAAA